MFQVLGDLVPYAIPVALCPFPILVVIMPLLGRGGVAGGAGFAAGRVAIVAALTVIAAFLAGWIEGEAMADIFDRGSWLRIAFGVILVIAAIVLWWRRPTAGATGGATAGELPGWIRAIESAGPARAFWLGMFLTVAEMKELVFVLGAGLLIGQATLTGGETLALSLTYAILAGLGPAVPVVWVALAGRREGGRLEAARDWLARYQTIVVAAVLLVIGAMLIGSGIEAL